MEIKLCRKVFVVKEPLPCPFCGNNKLILSDYLHGEAYYVVCERCENIGPLGETEEDAIEKWNTRYSPKGEKE